MRQATGRGGTFRERKKTKVSWAKCGVAVSSSYPKDHMSMIHGICVPRMRGVSEVEGGPTTYVVSFPNVLQEVRCAVLG